MSRVDEATVWDDRLRSTPVAIALIVVVAFLTSFVGIGDASLWETDEPFYVESSRQMLESGEWLTPVFNGEPRFQKPILFYWMQVASYRLFGVSEGAARFPSALAGLLSAIVLFLLGRRLAGPVVGLMAAVALLTMFRIAVFTRLAMTDTAVLCFVLVALYGLVRTLPSGGDPEPSPSRWALLAWGAMGLGVLTKGPMGILPLLVWGPFLVVTRRWDGFRRLAPGPGLAVFLATAVPWYAYMVWRHGAAYLDVSLMSEVVARVASDDFGGPLRGPLYYFSVWPADMFPWTPFFVVGAAILLARWTRLEPSTRQTALLATVWFVVIQAVFSVSTNKQPHYILPAYPAAALLVALAVDVTARHAGRARLALGAAGAALGLAALGLGGLSFAFLTRVLGNPPLSPPMLFPLVAVAGGLTMLVVGARGSSRTGFAAVAASATLAYGALGAFIVPGDLERLKPIKPLARVIEPTLRPDDRVGLLQNVSRGNVVSGLSLVYYSGHRVDWFDTIGQAAAFFRAPGRAFCLMQEVDFRILESTYRQPLYVLGEGEMFMMNLSHLFEDDVGRRPRRLVMVSNRPG